MYYDHKKIEWLKERYPEGTRICLDQMNDDPFPVESGTFGKVDHVDDIGTVHCVFDNGRTLGVDRKSTRLNSSHASKSRMPSSA